MSHDLPASNMNAISPKTTLKPLALCVSAVLLTACGSTTPTQTTQTVTAPTRMVTPPPRGVQPKNLVQANAALLDDDSLDELEGLLEATDMTMVENNSLVVQKYGNVWDRMRSGFKMNPNQYDPRIEAQKSWFISRQDYLNRLSARASRYLYHTVREAERRNIPTELALLPVIESSYDPLASSNAAAVGLWQFIPSTGRIYGLNQSSTFDGRRDVIESTRAAYDFLTTLYNQFGSWELALASYNAGPGRIQSAINYNQARGLPTDYWSLKLPTETMNYVPRFLAVAQIVKNPDNYGIYLPAIANRQHFRSVPANVGVTLNEVSNLTGVPYDELRALNPGLLAGMVDASGPSRILIPNEVNTNLDSKITKLKGNGFSSYPAYTPPTTYPTVTTGTTVTSEPQPNWQANNTKLPSSSSELASFANSMVKNQTTSYVAPIIATNTPAKSSEPPLTILEQKQVTQQMVKENTLPTTSVQITPNKTIIQEPPLSPVEKDAIAKQIEQTTPQVAQVINPVDGNIKIDAIQTQQSILDAKGETKQLSYGTPAPTTTTVATNTANPTTATVTTTAPTTLGESGLGLPTMPQIVQKPRPTGTRSTYQVKSGDTLGSIASRMGVKAGDIAEWNQIDPSKGLLAGATLYLYNAKPIAEPTAVKPLPKTITKKTTTPESYVVQPGDTLLGIANKYDLSVSELAKYNNIPTTYAVKTKQTLWLIPNKVKPTPVVTPKPVAKTPNYPTTTYRVKSGDGLIALADTYNISASELASINGLNPTDDLLVGQLLKVPAPKKVVVAPKPVVTKPVVVAKPVPVAPAKVTVKPTAKTVSKPTPKAEPVAEKPKVVTKSSVKETQKDTPKVTQKVTPKPPVKQTPKITTKVTTTKTVDIKVTPQKPVVKKAETPKAVIPKKVEPTKTTKTTKK